MLILFETPAGFALFQVDDGVFEQVDKLYNKFEDISTAKEIVTLNSFCKFEDTTEALMSTTKLLKNKISDSLKTFLEESIIQKNIQEKLGVIDKKLANAIKTKLGIECVSDSNVFELFRCIRFQLNDLISTDTVDPKIMEAMSRGLAHSLGRYKIKFSPDKVDVMIIQAISLLDDLDKEINTYAMRVKEWYGWHFPELARILNDNMVYAKFVKILGSRSNVETVDLTDILDEDTAAVVKRAATMSMGSEISDEDISYVQELCDQVLESNEHREQLSDYIKHRMRAIAPNLTILVGEILGAKLIARAGSLVSLSKHPASTVQIIGAEKALFRALKAKKNTPKYGILYHASLVGHASPKNKGKISRVLANKTVLSARVDALGDEKTKSIGIENLKKIHDRLRKLEGEGIKLEDPVNLLEKYETPSNITTYNTSNDIILETNGDEENMDNGDGEEEVKKEKKGKKRKREVVEEEVPEEVVEQTPKKKEKNKKN
jgi:nucleolar protein 58